MRKPIEVFLRQCYHLKLQELPDRKRPSWSTHCDSNHISPVIDWESYINIEETKSKKVQRLSYQ
jgi:hypothetical protein